MGRDALGRDASRPEVFGHEVYLSPLTWRYGSPEMRALLSEHERRRLWRRVWVAVATAQAELGLVDDEQVEDLRAHQDDIDLPRAHAFERELMHDVMSEVHTFREQAPKGGAILHLGLTSMDVVDNADAIRLRRGLALVRERLRGLLASFEQRVREHAATPTMGFTHLQPAEPVTLGFRFATYAQDLVEDYRGLGAILSRVRAKGMRGAVGTSASYLELFGDAARTAAFEARVLETLRLRPFLLSTQTYPRKQDLTILDGLAQLGQSLYRFAFDLRVLQSPVHGELGEPFGKSQIGSSAMPFKKNPIHAENINSLARLLASLPRVAWDNAAHCLLERTLDDSANRRLVLPQALLLSDEIVRRATRVVDGLEVREAATERLLTTYGVFAATEKVLMTASKRGGDRQALHERIRDHAMAAWAKVQAGEANPLRDLLHDDDVIGGFVGADELDALLDARGHVGDSEARALAVADELAAALGETLDADERALVDEAVGAVDGATKAKGADDATTEESSKSEPTLPATGETP